jgi:hypothetical protein
MAVLDDGPQLSIPRDAAASFYSREGIALAGRVRRCVPFDATSHVEISVYLDVWRDVSVCGELMRSGGGW